MDFTIYFCVDGVLRAKFSDDKPLIPIKFLQDNSPLKSNDLRFWCHWWENTVYFENGLTVAKFLSCLEPWQAFWSDITGKDIKEYITESRRPHVMSAGDEHENSLDWICLSYYTEVQPNIEYHKDSDEELERDINAWLNSPKERKLTGEWGIHSCYKLTGFVKGEQEQYSIDWSPMDKLANLPIVLSDKQWLYFNDWQLKSFFGKGKEVLFKKNAFGLCKVGEKNKTKFLVGEKYHKMRDVVEGFFWWMCVTPSRREDMVNDLKESKEELDFFLEQEKNQKSEKVVSLFKVEENEDVEIKEVKIASGAFDSLIASHKRDKEYWEEMLEISKESNVILKIGKIESGQVLEKRIFSAIILPDDKEANPQPTEYKLR